MASDATLRSMVGRDAEVPRSRTESDMAEESYYVPSPGPPGIGPDFARASGPETRGPINGFRQKKALATCRRIGRSVQADVALSAAASGQTRHRIEDASAPAVRGAVVSRIGQAG